MNFIRCARLVNNGTSGHCLRRNGNSIRCTSRTMMIRHKSTTKTTGSADATKESSKDVMKESVEKAAQLHAELQELMHLRKKRILHEQEQPFGSSFVRFIRTNKAELINIGATFVCVMLAYQVTNRGKTIKKLENTIKEKEEDLDHKRSLLKSVTEPEFLLALGYETHQIIKEEQKAASKSSGIVWSRSAAPADFSEHIAEVFQKGLEQRIGDEGLSEDERKTKMVQKLQKAQEELILEQQLMQAVSKDDDTGGEMIAIEKEEGDVTIVKRRQFTI